MNSFDAQIGSNTYLLVRPVKISALIMAVNPLDFLGYMSGSPHNYIVFKELQSYKSLS